jgi:linoleoyl-CoA desaturase
LHAVAKRISFSNLSPDFSATLRKRIDDYFNAQRIKFTGNRKLYAKSAILLLLAPLIYTLLVFFPMPVWISILLCILLGLNLAAIGFNVMHDGAHGSFSRKPWVNDMMGYSLNIIGGCVYIWKQKHNLNHHNFTNIEGHDDDIDIQPWMRTSTNQPKRKFHRYQHIYWVFLYGLTYLIWVYVKDFQKYFTGKIADTPMKKMNRTEHIIFWVSKIFYFALFIGVPVLSLGVLKTLIGYLIVSFVCGWVLAIVFQVAHLVQTSEFPLPQEDTNKLAHDWTIHQILTTANFSTRSRIITWFAGGLNFQIEHHLFPRVSHIHYPAISKLVREVCHQYNVNYREFPTFIGAIRSHVTHLKLVGTHP